MELNDIQFFLDFTIWADGKVLDGARQVSMEQLRANHPMPYVSIFNTMNHIMNAQEFWLTTCGGLSLQPSTAIHDLDQLGAAWDAVHTDLRVFVAGLNVDQLKTNVTYTDINGLERVHPLQWLMMHIFNHSTEHRSQVAAMLATSGYDVGWLDIVFYMWHVSLP